MLKCSVQCFIKLHHWLVAKVSLCPLTAVVVVRSCQSHSHWREGGLDGEQWTNHPAKQLHHPGYEVHQPVREVVPGTWVAQALHHTWNEVPERQRSIVGDEIGLQHHNENHLIAGTQESFVVTMITFPHTFESLCKCSAARICPCTTFSTYVKSTMFFPSLHTVTVFTLCNQLLLLNIPYDILHLSCSCCRYHNGDGLGVTGTKYPVGAYCYSCHASEPISSQNNLRDSEIET